MDNKTGTRTVAIKGEPFELRGKVVHAGDRAENFTAVGQDVSDFDFYRDTDNKIKVISVTTSVDTGVCALQTARFNREATGLSEDVQIIAISVDLPYALKRFCAAEDIKNIQLVSDHRSLDFGEKYGFVIDKLRLLCRGILVIDRDNTVRYVEYVSENSNHPDYDRALDEIKKLVK